MFNPENIRLVKKYTKYLYPYLAEEFLLSFLLIVASIGSLATPYVLKIIIDDTFPKGNYSTLVELLLGLVGVYVIRIVSSLYTEILYAKVSEKIIADIRSDMFGNILDSPIGFFREVKSGDILFTLMNDVKNIQGALSSLVLNFLSDILTVIGIVVMLGILNLKLTVVSLLITPIILFSIRKFTPYIQQSFKRIQEAEEHLNNFFLERIRNIRVIKSYNAYDHEKSELKDIRKNMIDVHISNAFLTAFNSSITTFLIAIGPIIVLIYGGREVFEKTMTIGTLIAFIQYLNRLFAPSISIMNSYNQFARALISMERVEKYLTALVPESHKARRKIGSVEFRQIRFENISLTINDYPILKEVNIIFEKGKIYGIIGPSGSGKSSILNLLCGFLEPSGGRIMIDNSISINQIKDWASNISLIEKENQLFNGTIFKNIKYGTFDASHADVIEAIKFSCLADVIDNLPAKVNTVINDTGATLSDGQKQRISIARALLNGAPLIILDEATAALDIQLEQLVIANLKAHYKHSIIIIITHRLSSLQDFDYVYSVDNGKIIQEGTPKKNLSI